MILGPALLPVLHLGRREMGRTQMWVDAGVVEGERRDGGPGREAGEVRERVSWGRGKDRGEDGLWESAAVPALPLATLESWVRHSISQRLSFLLCAMGPQHAWPLGHCGGIPVGCLELRPAQHEWERERIANAVAQPRVACKAGIFSLVTQIRRMGLGVSGVCSMAS